MLNNRTGDQLFIGAYPTGIMYADRWHEDHGDYVKLAFLSFRTLELEIMDDCPRHLRQRIEEHAAGMIAKRGQRFQISTCGQYVTLGE